jgi:hypothetical protein
MVSIVDKFILIERELLHERFADFERGVLQDNIILCDAKSGVVLAFAGAMVVFCVDAFVGGHGHHFAKALFMVSAGAFLISCHFSLATVVPRLKRELHDHIFWEAPAYRLPVEGYVQQMLAIDVHLEHREKLRHLHMLAGICRSKFKHFHWAIRFGQAGFIVLILAELARIA